MGVLGWSPDQFWEEATISDVNSAFEGWAQANGVKVKPDLPSKSFMDDMMRRFPD